MSNLLLQTDSYKLTHFKQYPPNTSRVYSYLESRGGFFDQVTFCGLQYYLNQLAGVRFSLADVTEAEEFAAQHFGRRDCFNAAGWKRMFEKYNGLLPVEIRAVAEGTTVPVRNVLMTMENTDDEFPWLTNFLETILMKVWYPTSVCTLSREIKKVIRDFHVKTGSNLDGIVFKLHDFGYRGVSSEETAAIGGGAHLVNFMGTDTLAGIRMLNEHYQKGMWGFSIPAAEHSTITSWGREHEVDAYRNMLKQWNDGLVAVVSDSYDLDNAVKHIWGEELRSEVIKRQGVLVVRPDSGNPREVVLEVLKAIGENYGFETNQKGYRVLPPCIRVIQGDGVNYYTIQDTLAAMAKNGWAAENVAFGMGGALLQQLNRDTQQFAIKCSQVVVDGQPRDVWKTPTGDPSKASKRGRLALINMGDGRYSTVQTGNGIEHTSDCLEPVFRNGEVLQRWGVDAMRSRAALGCEK